MIVSVTANPTFVAGSVKVTLKVNVSSERLETSILEMLSVALAIVPVPVTADVSAFVSFIE